MQFSTDAGLTWPPVSPRRKSLHVESLAITLMVFSIYGFFSRSCPVTVTRTARRIAWAMTVLLASAGSIIAAETAAPKKVAAVEGITEYQLDNGLRVLLYPDSSRPTVTINMVVLVGSRHEGYGETGMAHLLEHMLFKGTMDHPSIPKVLTEHGAQFNASTSDDRTNYYETVPASNENLDYFLCLEADRLVNSFVRKSDLDFEMTVVRN